MISNKPLNILIIGPSGSGKGTQAKMLAEKYNLQYLQSGEVSRKWAKGKTEFAKKIREAMNKGFVPSEWIFRMIKEEFANVDKNRGLMLDSFSRLLPEIKMLYQALAGLGRKLDYVFLINISDKEAIERLLKRGICPKCEQIVIIKSDKERICTICGGKVSKREDDNPESIKKRLADFRNKTLLVADYIKKNDRLIEIDGEQLPEKVFEDIVKNIES